MCMLKSCSLSPYFALSDVPGQDLHLLEFIFPLLTNDLEDHDPSDENASSLPRLPLTGSITCPNSIEIMIAAINILDGDLNDKPDIENIVVSIYFEYPIYDFGRVKGKIGVAQIGSNLSNEKRHRLVLPFDRHTNNQKFLKWLQ